MAIEAFADLNCSVARPLSFLGERWALLVLRDLFLGRRRFDEIQESLGVATNVLSQRLATLVEEGIVERRRYSEHPERFEYRLTEKGRDLQPVLLAMLAWGDRYTAGPTGPPLETVHDECGKRLPHGPDLLGVRRRGRRAPHPQPPRPGRDAEQRRRAEAQTRRAAERRRRVDSPLGASADHRLRLPRQGAGGAAARPRAGRCAGPAAARRAWRRSRRPGSSRRWPTPTGSGRVLELVGDVAVVFHLLGSAAGEPEALAAIHGPRLERLLEKVVDTPGARRRLRGGGQRRRRRAGGRGGAGRGRVADLAHPGRGRQG